MARAFAHPTRWLGVWWELELSERRSAHLEAAPGARSPPLAAQQSTEESYRCQEADLRAIALLMKWLSPEQRTQYEREWCFEIIGSVTGRRYRIVHDTQFNIEELDADGHAITALCFKPEGLRIVGDVMLAQKIALETNETAALCVAKRPRRA